MIIGTLALLSVRSATVISNFRFNLTVITLKLSDFSVEIYRITVNTSLEEEIGLR